jgi:adenylate kinase family enzyme
MTPPPVRIHVVGASGSGTTTLGAALAHEIGAAYLDTDAFFWAPTDPQFTTKRPAEARLALLEAELDRRPAWVLSGSLMSWGDGLIPRFQLVVFLHVPAEVRIERVLRRERQRYGNDVDPGGRMHESHKAFIAWARGYDKPDFESRSLVRHRAWLERMACPVVEIAGAPTAGESLERVMSATRLGSA